MFGSFFYPVSGMSVTIRSLHFYPIKSCAGTSVRHAVVDGAGLAWDRRWLVVGENGIFMTQRGFPRMALIVPTVQDDVLRIQAPGMDDLFIGLDAGRDQPEEKVVVWRATLAAHPVGSEAARWFSEVLGVPCSLYRVAEPLERLPDDAFVQPWVDTFGEEAGQTHEFAFADGFPLLVANQASLDALNERLQAAGHAPVPMDRFRPNIVIDGLEAFDEDHVAWLDFAGMRLGLIKPCTRCTVPDVDQATGQPGMEPGQTLAQFRRFDAGVMFGQNAIVAAGAGAILAVDDEGEFEYAF